MTAQLTTGLHSVDGASIYHEIRGHGPTLLMISGGGGDAGYYTPVADRLADQFTVITYDRRGNSRSTRDANQDMVVAQQSADARSLIEALGTPPAFVFGNSGGAIIALDLAARYPAGLAAVIAHEPPVVHVLPDAAEQLAFFDELQSINRQEGWYPAWLRFAGTIGREEANPTDGGAWDETTFKRIGGNLEFLIAREMQAFIDFTPDIQGIKDGGARVVLAGGRASKGYYYYRPAPIIAEELGAEFVEFPGHHNGYLDHPDAFAATLRQLLVRLGATVR